MEIEEIIIRLEKSRGPDAELDRAIAIEMGYTRRVKYWSKPEGKTAKRVLWVVPNGEDLVPQPRYTESIDEAYRLAQALAPSMAGGCSWERNEGTARIYDGPYCRAANPAIALCIAALKHKLASHYGLNDDRSSES